jgi:hypothetical protein
MEFNANITDYIAIYAAILSSFVFLWNINKSKSKIVVTIILGINDTDGEIQHGIYINIRNPSAITVHLTSVSFLYPYRRITLLEKLKFVWKYKRFHRYIGWVHSHLIFHDIDTGLPRSIEPYNSHAIFVPEQKILEMLKKDGGKIIAAEVQDALWRNKCSSPFEMHDPLK